MDNTKEYRVRMDQYTCGCEVWERRYEHDDHIEVGGQEEIICQDCQEYLGREDREMSHTEGPWVYRYTALQDGTGGETEHSVVHYRNEAPYAETKDEYICRKVSNEANARLIAAAPELLAACQQTIDFVWEELRENPDKEDMDGSIMDRLIELQTSVISATRKAKGK